MKKITGYIVSYFTMLIMLCLFISVVVDFYQQELNLFNILFIVIFGLMGYAVFYVMIYPLMKWNRYLKKIHKLFVFPIMILALIMRYYMNVGAGLLFLMFYILPTAMIVQFVPNSFEMKMGLIYIVNVLAVVIFTYKAEWVIKLIEYTFDKFQPRIFNKFAKKVNYRIVTYGMMIGIYVLYNFNLFSNNIMQFKIDLDITLIKEVFVTFIAIDSLIQILKGRNDNVKGEEQKSENIRW
ncbi:hypothetical protein ACIQYS_15865 [Psychrobacillus sp. NPDC096426]|uniref:hypothetical protein n=1 Tax=Psychrobacillus sp. NPDC096426 TaxID=3364491 RepID=UPI00382BC63D